MSALDRIRARWACADWQYRARELNSGRIGSVGIEHKDGTPIASSPFPEEAETFKLLAQAPDDIKTLLELIDEIST